MSVKVLEMSSAEYLKELISGELNLTPVGHDAAGAFLENPTALGTSDLDPFNLICGRIRWIFEETPESGMLIDDLPDFGPHYLNVQSLLGAVTQREAAINRRLVETGRETKETINKKTADLDRITTYHQIYQILRKWDLSSPGGVKILADFRSDTWRTINTAPDVNWLGDVDEKKVNQFKKTQRGNTYERSAIDVISHLFAVLSMKGRDLSDFFRWTRDRVAVKVHEAFERRRRLVKLKPPPSNLAEEEEEIHVNAVTRRMITWSVDQFYTTLIQKGFPVFVEDYRFTWNKSDEKMGGTLKSDVEGARRLALIEIVPRDNDTDPIAKFANFDRSFNYLKKNSVLHLLESSVGGNEEGELWIAVANYPDRHFPLFHSPHQIGWTLKPNTSRKGAVFDNTYDNQCKFFLKLANHRTANVLSAVVPLVVTEDKTQTRKTNLCDWFNWAHTDIKVPVDMWTKMKEDDPEWALIAERKFDELLALDGIVIPIEILSKMHYDLLMEINLGVGEEEEEEEEESQKKMRLEEEEEMDVLD
jgi:hypothetical protein